MPITNQFGQTFYEEEAMLVFPEGCTCGPFGTPGNNTGGDCPFCQIYYGEVVPRTEHVYPPIPIRTCDWCCYDDNTYDGAPDADPQVVGWGKTEAEAIADFWEQWKEQCHAR